MLEQMKRAMVDDTRGVWLSESRGKNRKNVRWNDVVKATVERKEAEWREVLGAWDEVAKE